MIGGVLLTGGSSRRLGTDKARLTIDGVDLATRCARLLSSVCDAAVEVGPGCSTLPSVLETPRGGGPLVAMLAGFDALAAAHDLAGVLVVSCDLPHLNAALLELLASWPAPNVVPVAQGRLQPLCAKFDAALMADARARVARGERSLRWIDDTLVTPLPESVWHAVAPPTALLDLDTTDDAAAFGIELPERRT